ncbi:MAG TPA: TonB-dependent receptor, partial [Candidatus Eremiobacteraceae bacterium]|nr:TonB-dependent receptor [Candidatus Eremiobacteraceae bacterium]
FNGAQVNSTITKTSYFDPRLAFVDQLGHNYTVRAAAGVASVQPYATMIDLPFAPIAQGALNGALNCSGLTSIGNVANPNLLPERADDQEISIAKGFYQDSQVQLTLYNENIPNKLFQSVIPVLGLPSGTIDATTLTNFATAINSKCGTSGLGSVGVLSYANIGHMLAQGIDLTGRARASHQLFADFNFSTESVTLRSIPVSVLQNNLTYIIGAQLPAVPLHKGQVALDYTFPGNNIDVRLQQSWVAANNSKNLTAYNYGDLVITAPIAKNGRVNIGVNNVWNQYAFYNGLIGNGVPLALNQYATPANYGNPLAGSGAALLGAQATEEFGLPYRAFFMSYTFRAH